MTGNDALGAWPVWTTRARLAGVLTRITIHCYTQNINAMGLAINTAHLRVNMYSHVVGVLPYMGMAAHFKYTFVPPPYRYVG